MKLHERVLPLILGIFCCGFLSGCATYSVIGSFSDYKEVFLSTERRKESVRAINPDA